MANTCVVVWMILSNFASATRTSQNNTQQFTQSKAATVCVIEIGARDVGFFNISTIQRLRTFEQGRCNAGCAAARFSFWCDLRADIYAQATPRSCKCRIGTVTAMEFTEEICTRDECIDQLRAHKDQTEVFTSYFCRALYREEKAAFGPRIGDQFEGYRIGHDKFVVINAGVDDVSPQDEFDFVEDEADCMSANKIPMTRNEHWKPRFMGQLRRWGVRKECARRKGCKLGWLCMRGYQPMGAAMRNESNPHPTRDCRSWLGLRKVKGWVFCGNSEDYDAWKTPSNEQTGINPPLSISSMLN